MKIAIYTLTRDRLKYTKECFAALKRLAGVPYEHFIIDNGSTDGTVKWLHDNMQAFTMVKFNPENLGIHKGCQQALELIKKSGAYDLIIKMDNDCLIKTPNILSNVIRVANNLLERKTNLFVISPKVINIKNQPVRKAVIKCGHYTLGRTCMVGGLFSIAPRAVYERYVAPNNLPLAWGWDSYICDWVNKQPGGVVGYIEELEMEHYLGTSQQQKDYPVYFARKKQEEHGRKPLT